MQMTYDNYDFEEAYKKQIDTLEEFELERLIKEHGVSCLYRTKTTKSKSLKTDKTLLEAQIYPSFRKRADAPKVKSKNKESQKKLNQLNSERMLIRLVNINFGEGDLILTGTYDDENMPETEEEVQKDITNYIARIKYWRRKKVRGSPKYVYIITVTEEERYHFHLIIEGDGIDRDKAESLWKKGKRTNSKRAHPDEKFLLTGIATYISKNTKKSKKKWVPSKNLKRPPKPTKSYSKFKKRKVEAMVRDYETLKSSMEKAYPGYKYLDNQIYHNGINGTFYLYVRMIRD